MSAIEIEIVGAGTSAQLRRPHDFPRFTPESADLVAGTAQRRRTAGHGWRAEAAGTEDFRPGRRGVGPPRAVRSTGA